MGEKLETTHPQENIDSLKQVGSEQLLQKVGEDLEHNKATAETQRREEADDVQAEAVEIAHQHEKAQQAEAQSRETDKQSSPPLTRRDIDASYQKTLKSVQSQLPKPSRAFSKVIHSPVVEKTSDAIGNTVARPNLIIAGAIGAISSCIIYVIAKKYGYLLSGSETIILFVAGWCVGAVIEYARVGLFSRHDGR